MITKAGEAYFERALYFWMEKAEAVIAAARKAIPTENLETVSYSLAELEQALTELDKVGEMKMTTTLDEWIDNDGGSVWTCSECAEEWVFECDGPPENFWQYCPRCGRKIAACIPAPDPYPDEEDD